MLKKNIFVPRIERGDYSRLRILLGENSQMTFEQWQNVFIRRELKTTNIWFDVHYIQIDPEEFGRFLIRTNTQGCIEAIDIFMERHFVGERF